MKQQVLRLIPKSLKPILKKIYYIPMDILDMLTKRDSMIPPRSMIFIGSGDFIKIGEDFMRYFVDLGNLKPSDRVLDVGCGIGRMAIPLTNYLSRDGEYWGFDIVKSGIEWCQQRITPKHSNFHFLHSNVYNKHYNPDGTLRAQDFKFPFDNEFFDFIFLTSVFTHMLPRDVENYMEEISRVLKKDGKCMITFFILNEESKKLIQTGISSLDFRYQIDGCLSTDINTPEEAIAFNEDFIINLFERYGLTIVQPVLYGSWCNRVKFFTYQDMIIANKANKPQYS